MKSPRMENDQNGRVVFTKKVNSMGGSNSVIIPKPLADWLEVNFEELTEVKMAAFEGKKGKFIAIWKD